LAGKAFYILKPFKGLSVKSIGLWKGNEAGRQQAGLESLFCGNILIAIILLCYKTLLPITIVTAYTSLFKIKITPQATIVLRYTNSYNTSVPTI